MAGWRPGWQLSKRLSQNKHGQKRVWRWSSAAELRPQVGPVVDLCALLCVRLRFPQTAWVWKVVGAWERFSSVASSWWAELTVLAEVGTGRDLGAAFPAPALPSLCLLVLPGPSRPRAEMSQDQPSSKLWVFMRK